MGLRQGDSQHPKAGILSAWLPVLGVAAVVVALGLGGDPARDLLAYERESIASGQLWRLLSAHFVHLGYPHLFLNLAGLALAWYLVGDAWSGAQWLQVWAASVLLVSSGLWFLEPQLGWYVGLSGVLHGLLAAGIAGSPPGRAETWVLAAALAGKLGWEQLAGPLPGSEATSGGDVIVDAHLFGAIGGLLAAVLIRVRAKASI